MPSNYLILCCPHLLLLSIFPSNMIFSNESDLPIRWPKYWSFCFSISPSNEYLGWISFRIYRFDLYLPQNHISKALILWHSAFFIVQLSHPYTTGWWTVFRLEQLFHFIRVSWLSLSPVFLRILIAWMSDGCPTFMLWDMVSTCAMPCLSLPWPSSSVAPSEYSWTAFCPREHSTWESQAASSWDLLQAWHL